MRILRRSNGFRLCGRLWYGISNSFVYMWGCYVVHVSFTIFRCTNRNKIVWIIYNKHILKYVNIICIDVLFGKWYSYPAGTYDIISAWPRVPAPGVNGNKHLSATETVMAAHTQGKDFVKALTDRPVDRLTTFLKTLCCSPICFLVFKSSRCKYPRYSPTLHLVINLSAQTSNKPRYILEMVVFEVIRLDG